MHVCKDCARHQGSSGHSSDNAYADQGLDLGDWAMEVAESTGSRLVWHLTLMLMYLTSWHDGPDEAKRSWKTFSPEVVDELVACRFVQTRPGSKTVAFSEQGEEAALLLLERYGFETPGRSPLTLREIKLAIGQLPALEREDLISELLNNEMARAEDEHETPCR